MTNCFRIFQLFFTYFWQFEAQSFLNLDFIGKNGILIPGQLNKVAPSVVWEGVILADTEWFTVNYQYASGIMKDVNKQYKKYLEKSRKQTQYLKDGFTLEKMTEKFEEILDKYLPSLNEEFEIPKLEELQTYE